MEADQPTTYTNDQVYDAVARLNAASAAQVKAADAIRGDRRKPKSSPINL